MFVVYFAGANIVVLIFQERLKSVSPTELTEEVSAPVRIAPVSSQLINAALSFGRNVRDPRIRQMSSRIESQLNKPSPLPPPNSKHQQLDMEREAKSKKPSPKKDRKSKDRHSDLHRENSSKALEENIKPLRSTRSNEKSPSKKTEKYSPKKTDGKNNKKSKVEDLFSTSKSPQREHAEQNSHLPSKGPSKKEQMNPPDTSLPKLANIEQISKLESSPKRTRLKDNNQSDISSGSDLNTSESLKQPPKLSVDIVKAHSTKEIHTVSPESMDSTEMLNEDIEKIVRNPIMISRTVKLTEPPKTYDDESLKSSDDSLEDSFEDIIRNPTKQVKFDKIIRADDLKTAKSVPLEAIGSEKLKLPIVVKVSNENSISNDLSLNNDQVSKKQSVVADSVLKNNVTEQTHPSKVTQSFPVESPQQTVFGSVKDPRLLNQKEEENTLELETIKIADAIVQKVAATSIKRLDPKVIAPISEVPNESLTEIENSNEQFASTGSSNYDLVEEAHPVVGDRELSSLFDIMKPSEEPNCKEVSQPEPDTMSPLSPEPMDTIKESTESVPPPTEMTLLKRQEKRQGSPPVHEERKVRKSEKPSIAEQIIADAERHEASPSPPPPSVISDKFKEIKQSSLSRLRIVGRPRENLEDSESPEPSDVDLRTQIPPPTLTKDLKSKLYHIILVVLALQEFFKYFVKSQCIKHLKFIVVFLSTHLDLVILHCPTFKVNEY